VRSYLLLINIMLSDSEESDSSVLVSDSEDSLDEAQWNAPIVYRDEPIPDTPPLEYSDEEHPPDDGAPPAVRLTVSVSVSRPPTGPGILRLPGTKRLGDMSRVSSFIPRICRRTTPLVFTDEEEEKTLLCSADSQFPLSERPIPITWTCRMLPPPLKVQLVTANTSGARSTWFVLTDEGELFAAGSNRDLLLGQTGPLSEQLEHTDELRRVAINERVVHVDAGATFALARVIGALGTQWYGWGSSGTALCFPPGGHHPPTHISKLDGVVDLWCANSNCFAVMRRPGQPPILCGWGTNHGGEAVPSRPGLIVDPVPIPGFDEWATQRNLRVLRVSCSALAATCLLGNDKGNHSVVMKWGRREHQLGVVYPWVLHDSATAERRADGSPRIIVDACALDADTLLMTCERELLFSGGTTQHGLVPVAGIRKDWLDFVLLNTSLLGDTSVLLGGRDGELWKTNCGTWPRGSNSLIQVQLPGKGPARLPVAALWSPRLELEAFIGAWAVHSRREIDPNNPDLMGSMPRQILRYINMFIMANSTRLPVEGALPPPRLARDDSSEDS